jgi:transposase
MHFFGIDVSSDHLDTVLIDADGTALRPPRRYPNTTRGILRLLADLPQPDSTVVLFECTGVYGKRLEALLPGRVAMLCPANPKVIKNAALSMTATKTDTVDARAIAEAARCLYQSKREVLDRYNLDEPPNADLECWLTEYDRLRKAMVRLKQQREALRHHPAAVAKTLRRRYTRDLERLQRQQDQARREIARLADSEMVRLIASINGIGTLTAAAVARRIRSIDRFESADKLKAYLGRYPVHKASGKRAGRARMAKHGDRLVRNLLFNCAKSAARWNPACKALYDRLIEKGHNAVYAWNAVMRKLVQIIYGVLKSGTPWNPEFGLTGNG